MEEFLTRLLNWLRGDKPPVVVVCSDAGDTVAVREDYTLRLPPTVKRQQTQHVFTAVADFCQFVSRWGGLGATVLVGARRAWAARGHAADADQASCTLRYSTAFTHWQGAFGKALTQRDAARHLRAVAATLLTGTELLAVVRQLSSRSVTEHKVELDKTGLLTVHGQTNNTTLSMSVPDEVHVSCRIYDDAPEMYDLKVLLHLQEREGALLWTFDCPDLDEVLRLAEARMVEQVRGALPESAFVGAGEPKLALVDVQQAPSDELLILPAGE